MSYIYLDESGQFTKHKDGKYFVLASFIIGNPNRTNKQFRSWHKTRFPKKLRFQPEIKFSEIRIDKGLRLQTLKFIADLDIRIQYNYLEKKNIPSDFRNKNKIKSGHLYTNIVGELLEKYIPINDKEFRVFCDQRHLKGIKRSQFKNILTARLKPLLSKDCIIQIEMIDSTTNANIQIADWIAGAISWYVENKQLGKECFQILKNNIITDGQELFKNYWSGKFTNEKLNHKD